MKEMKPKVLVIRPKLKINDENVIIGFDYLDVIIEGRIIKISSFEELWKLANEEDVTIKIYCYLFQPLMWMLEKWCKENYFAFPTANNLLYYSGKPKKSTCSLIHATRSMNESAAPHTVSAKIFYQDKTFIFFDICRWKTNSRAGSLVTIEEMQSIYNWLTKVEEILIPQYLEKAGKRHKGKIPSSLASLSRVLVKDPSFFQNKERDLFLIDTKSAYVSGLNYLDRSSLLKRYQEVPLYYYDISSMYAYILTSHTFPDPFGKAPKHYDGFKEVAFDELGMYHIRKLYARLKRNHIPTIFTQENIRMKLKIVDIENLFINQVSSLYGWITSVDYEMLLRDYTILQLEIDETYIYQSTAPGLSLFGDKLVEFYNLKENSTDEDEKACYKGILNTFSGSIGMTKKMHYRVSSLIEDDGLAPLLINTNPIKKDRPFVNESCSAYDIGAFMTAYGRKMISDLALKAGGKNNVKCISTDAIVVKNPYRVEGILTRKGLGGLRLEKVMYHAHWFNINQYEWQDENGNWNGKISGLSSVYYKHGQKHYEIPEVFYVPWKDKDHPGHYEIKYVKFSLQTEGKGGQQIE